MASTLFLYNPVLIIALTFSLSSCKHSDSSLKDRDHIGDFPGTTFEGGVSLAAGDFDGDGDLDFIGSNTRDYGVFLYTNNGKGQFTDKGRVENLPGTTFEGDVSLAAGDFDGDGDLDFIGSNTRDYGVFLYTNNGKGQFTDKGRVENLPGTTFKGGVSLAVGDFDGDGDLDFIGSNTRDYGVFLYTNNGKGQFTDKGRIENLPGTTFEGGVSLAVGDFDGDGDLDFIGSNTDHYGIYLFYEGNDSKSSWKAERR